MPTARSYIYSACSFALSKCCLAPCKNSMDTHEIHVQAPGPWGFRIFGGDGQPLIVAKVRNRSPAAEAGLKENDVLISINSHSCEHLDHKRAMEILDEAQGGLCLQVLRGTTNKQDISNAFRALSNQQNVNNESLEKIPLSSTENVHHESDIWKPREQQTSFKVTAQENVSITRNADESITMSVGMQYEKENTPPQPIFRVKQIGKVDEAVWKPATFQITQQQQQQQQPQQQHLSQTVPHPSNSFSQTSQFSYQEEPTSDHCDSFYSSDNFDFSYEADPSDNLIGKLTNRESTSDDGRSSPESAMRRKKIFADSAFYDDDQHKYPTIEEQIKMARRVAMSLTAPINNKARGHRMFVKRQQRSEKWTYSGGELHEKKEFDSDSHHFMQQPWEKTWSNIERSSDETPLNFGEIPVAPPLPANAWRAPVLPVGKGKEKESALSAEEFERMRLLEQKNTHDSINPQMCFNLAAALKSSKGKGGQIFAKRKARADKYIVDESNVALPATSPNKNYMAKILASTNFNQEVEETKRVDSGPPPNKLDTMISRKPKMTPWEAAASDPYNIEPAFEHLYGWKVPSPNEKSFTPAKVDVTQPPPTSDSPQPKLRQTNSQPTPSSTYG
ncbi:DgyrCDS11455 [Dimorphilus gyrociliatus]|uniref:DgyrCDS11455 n=1 Tax=Dimorphilus gyrociliatus TaxID=2664684 RepID=A0A7I8W4B4_9ANNE|nr:DgyrCDS11455 [Dimorphilus gyrociliatus]